MAAKNYVKFKNIYPRLQPLGYLACLSYINVLSCMATLLNNDSFTQIAKRRIKSISSSSKRWDGNIEIHDSVYIIIGYHIYILVFGFLAQPNAMGMKNTQAKSLIPMWVEKVGNDVPNSNAHT